MDRRAMNPRPLWLSWSGRLGILFCGIAATFAAGFDNVGKPVIGPIANLTFPEEINGSILFEVEAGDTPLKDLMLTAGSSNPSVIPDSGILFTGVGRHRSAILSPAQPGQTRIHISVSDGRASAARSFEVTVSPRASSSPEMLLSVVVNERPRPAIRLIFPSDAAATNYQVCRKTIDATSWGEPIGTLPGTATSFADTNVTPGSAYEYRVTKNSLYPAYLYAGIRAPMMDDHGTLLLLVDQSQSTALQKELLRLQGDLAGEGWKVIRHDVPRDEVPVNIKAIIKREYETDPARVKAVFLFGHVPIAYSGSFQPDGHHERAFPADVFYADMDGVWTDDSTATIQPARHETRNYPDDGRYDQAQIPSDVELQIGRVDLFNLPAFLPKTETDLLRQYLGKNHRFRRGQLRFEPRGLADGWTRSILPNQSAMFGASQVFNRGFFSALRSDDYLWASRAQYGNYRGFNDGAGSTASFASADLRTAFVELAGSYFGEWDIWDNFLRAPLGMPEHGLTASYAMPSWRYHHLALGETMGFAARLNQNIPTQGGPYSSSDANARKVHIALMGDPTLRLHPISPVTELTPSIRDGIVRLTWKEPDVDVEGYLVHRASLDGGPIVRRTGTLLRETSFVDENVTPGEYTYMVRPLRLQVSGSGTYFNLGPGAARTVSVVPAPDMTPPIVKFISPTPGFDVYQSAEFVASSGDDRGISKVEFLVDGALGVTAVEEPFTFRWNAASVPPGQHFITAQATDYAGNTAQDRIRVNLVRSDTVAPSVSVTEPAAGRRVWGNVIIRTSARDNAALDRVELRVDDQLVGTARTEPYDFIWKTYDSNNGSQTVPDGVHRIRATAFDRSGNRSEQTLAVTVDGALSRPTILRASPENLVAQPGQVVELTYHWQGGPARQEWMVFTHLVDASGKNEVADAHSPTIPTHYWSGDYSYPVKFRVKRTLAPGKYKIMAGLFSGSSRLPLTPGPGVAADDQNRFEIGTLTVMPDTAPPKLAFSTWKPGQTFSGQASLSVRAVDNVAVDHVEMLVDGRPQTRILMSPNVTGRDLEISDNHFFTGSYTWDTSGVANGPHRVNLRSVDTAGNQADLEMEIKIGRLTISMATPAIITARPGETVKLTYNWSGGDIPDQTEVVTEVVDESRRRVVFRSDHKPPPASENRSSDDVAYSQDLTLAKDIAPGLYKITVRMLLTAGRVSGAPVSIESGRGVVKLGSGPNARNVIGNLTVVTP